jgi:hypothetical protein
MVTVKVTVTITVTVTVMVIKLVSRARTGFRLLIADMVMVTVKKFGT